MTADPLRALDVRSIITDTIGFEFQDGEFQTVNADDLLRLATAISQAGVVEDYPIDARENAEYIDACASKLEKLGLKIMGRTLHVIAAEHRRLVAPINPPEVDSKLIVPDGWVLVPREPTEEMLRAGWDEGESGEFTETPDYAAAYRAMIQAGHEKVYACDFCGKDYTSSAMCCSRRREYLDYHKLAAAPAAPGVSLGWDGGDAFDQFIAAEVDSAPEALRRLGDWLCNVLDEDLGKTASAMVLGAMMETSAAIRAVSSAAPAVVVDEAMVQRAYAAYMGAKRGAWRYHDCIKAALAAALGQEVGDAG